MFCYRYRVLALATSLLIGIIPTSATNEENKLPNEAQAILERAGQFDLLSIDPGTAGEKSKDAFRGWKVLGKTAVKEAETRRKVVAALLKGVAKGSVQDVARCFKPRHGIHVNHEGKTADFIICFECGQVRVVVGEQKQKGAYITRSAQPTFDTMLREAGFPLAPKAKTRKG